MRHFETFFAIESEELRHLAGECFAAYILDPNILAIFYRSIINARDGESAEEIIVAEIKNLGGEWCGRILVCWWNMFENRIQKGGYVLEIIFQRFLCNSFPANSIDSGEVYL